MSLWVVTENIKYADEYPINILRGYRSFRVAFMVTSELRLKSDPFFLGRKRSEMDILARILVEVVKGTRKTHILHKYDLSYRQLRVYLKVLYDLGFLMFGAKSETGGFRERADAEAAHYALDRLESHLPKAEVSDRSFNRMGKLRMRWPDGPRTPPQDLAWNEWLKKEL